ncbi:MAG TPA: helix-turn-helix transcriptional regulator [Trebonia sp.]
MALSSPSQELARRLRDLRQECKLTQKELGAALGGDQALSAPTIASWENKSAPKLPPQDRILAYAQFFATPRSMEGSPGLLPLEDLTPEEHAAYEVLRDEFLRLHAAVRPTSTEASAPRKSWKFSDDGPITFVCAQLPEEEASPLANPAKLNHTALLGIGDLDAMVELWGHVRMENAHMEVAYKSAPQVAADDLSGHVVIIGGIGWNDVTRRILDLAQLPVTQVDEKVPDGDVFVALVDGKEKPYLPSFSPTDPTKLTEDVGLLVRMPNPLNSNRTLTMCNGTYSRGVLGAVRALTDKRLRDSNERYIARHFSDNQQFGILMRVQVIEGVAMTPDFNTDGTVLYQWSSASGTTSPEASRAQARR